MEGLGTKQAYGEEPPPTTWAAAAMRAHDSARLDPVGGQSGKARHDATIHLRGVQGCANVALLGFCALAAATGWPSQPGRFGSVA
jgi:hypothetical protein